MSKWIRTITMKDIGNLFVMHGTEGVKEYLGYAAMQDAPMTENVVKYGIILGILLPDYTCGWSDMA